MTDSLLMWCAIAAMLVAVGLAIWSLCKRVDALRTAQALREWCRALGDEKKKLQEHLRFAEADLHNLQADFVEYKRLRTQKRLPNGRYAGKA